MEKGKGGGREANGRLEQPAVTCGGRAACSQLRSASDNERDGGLMLIMLKPICG